MEQGSEDPRALKQKIAELEEENRSLRDLVEVLKNLPAAREQLAERLRQKAQTKTRGKPAGKREVRRGAEGRGGTPARDSGEEPPG
jgi:hypothetical protein